MDQDVGGSDPGAMGAEGGPPPVADMRAAAWIVAILRMMTASSDRMADHLAAGRGHYVRDSRDLWDRYRYLIGIYEGVAGALPDPFKATFTAWQDAFLESGAGEPPIDRASHYRTIMTRFFKWFAVTPAIGRQE